MPEAENALIKKLIKGYNDSKLSLIKKLVDENEDMFNENNFLDDGFIIVKIEHLKRDYKKLTEELDLLMKYDNKEDFYKKQKTSSIIQQQRQIIVDIAFYSSNGYDNVEKSFNMLKNIETDFKICLDALISYKIGDINNALDKFLEFYSDKTYLLDHYLINKTYGKILFKGGCYKEAIDYLRKAVEKRPEDVEVHRLLRDIYKFNNQILEMNIEIEIITLLGGNI